MVSNIKRASLPRKFLYSHSFCQFYQSISSRNLQESENTRIMHFSTIQALAAFTSLLALSSASPLASPSDALEALMERDGNCNSCNDPRYPLARKLGTRCGVCPTYQPGDYTCSCNLDAIVSPPFSSSP